MRDAQCVGGHVGTLNVRDDIGEQHRLCDEERSEKSGDGQQSAADDAAEQAPVAPPRAPQRHSPEPHQQQAGGDGEQPGEVVTGRPDGGGVVAGLDGADTYAEDTDDQRQHAAPPRPHPPVGPCRDRQQGNRDQPAGQVVGG